MCSLDKFAFGSDTTMYAGPFLPMTKGTDASAPGASKAEGGGSQRQDGWAVGEGHQADVHHF